MGTFAPVESGERRASEIPPPRASRPRLPAWVRLTPLVNELTRAVVSPRSSPRNLAVPCGQHGGHWRCFLVVMARFAARSWSSRPAAEVPDDYPSTTRLRVSGPVAAEPEWSDPCEDLRVAADRFRAGDFHSALLAAMRALDAQPVPLLRASATYLASANLTTRERMLIALIDDVTPLESLFESCGLGMLEGIDSMCELLDLGICTFDPDELDDDLETLPGVAE